MVVWLVGGFCFVGWGIFKVIFAAVAVIIFVLQIESTQSILERKSMTT